MGNAQLERNEELRAAVADVRTIRLMGFDMVIEPDVFPPDLGLSSLMMARLVEALPVPACALDMGTGAGFLAMTMKRHGAGGVVASDIHAPAIRCAALNFAANGLEGGIDLVESDLFAAIPSASRFDLVVFNQPFYAIAGAPIAGMGEDGGRAITQRFLNDVRAFLARGGRVMMASAALVDERERPDILAREGGWTIARTVRSDDGNVFVWLFARPDGEAAVDG